jgi:hypothetical protein
LYKKSHADLDKDEQENEEVELTLTVIEESAEEETAKRDDAQ